MSNREQNPFLPTVEPPPAEVIDLDAYFRRIGYSGPRTSSLDTLKAIVLHHALAIPFENLNPLLRRPVRLDLESLQQKLVYDERGGYCFEQNSLLSAVLQVLGFQVTPLAGRVMWNAPEGVVRPRSHMVLRIDIDQTPYIVDVGFGGLTLTGVLHLEPDVEQSTPHEPFRFVRADDNFVMQANVAGTWQSLYRFDLSKQLPIDYEVISWYICNHPDSHFLHGLIAARAERDRRYTLHNNALAVHYLDGRNERHVLTTVDDLRSVLIETIRIALPDTPDLDAALQQIIANSQENGSA
ncbi:MAG: arylamine N-acetyltransferase [Anaerolineae bacterium]|nr:arylamine N-acetyltransferase [Anaerolineae bacterium]